MAVDERGIVFLLHGVDCDLGDDGAPLWYQKVRRELDFFFDVIEIRYTRYDRFGKAWVASLVGAVAVASASAAATLWYGGTSWPFIAGAFLTLGIGAAFSIYEWRRRTATTREIATQITKHFQKGRKHHLIGHSFGTFLLPRALKRTIASLHHVILAGSVLTRRYPWGALRSKAMDGVRPFHRIRNEHSQGDMVAAAAGVLWALSGCGCAGAFGFADSNKRDQPAVHQVLDPYGPCNTISRECRTAPIIHNVALGEYGHSDHFLSEVHARELWLPVLWFYEPHAYNEFVARCGEILLRREDGFSGRARELTEILLDERFPFFSLDEENPLSIRSAARANGVAQGVQFTDDDLLWITEKTAEMVMSAWRRPDASARTLAYPNRALRAAVKDILKQPQFTLLNGKNP